MSADHVFVASGEACPICEALAGLPVEPGYRPHPNCNCNTVRMKKGRGTCHFDYTVTEIWENPGGRHRVQMSLTVTCPDGTVKEAHGAAVDYESMIEGEEDAWLEGVAEMECEEHCEDNGETEDEFLCC